MDPAGYQVALDVFEGPLDLLLHLVKKHELSILGPLRSGRAHIS